MSETKMLTVKECDYFLTQHDMGHPDLLAAIENAEREVAS